MMHKKEITIWQVVPARNQEGVKKARQDGTSYCMVEIHMAHHLEAAHQS
jgi:hypothetical protein